MAAVTFLKTAFGGVNNWSLPLFPANNSHKRPQKSPTARS